MMQQNPPGADCMFVCPSACVREGVKYAVRVCVRLLIACAGGEGHGFNQATCHSSQKGCKLSHTHTHSQANTYVQRHG